MTTATDKLRELWDDELDAVSGGLYASIALIALLAAFTASSALAQQTCETKAVGKDGKPLAGAAKTSFIKKCKEDACATKAVGSDGKPLSGAAKNSFMTECEKDA